MKITSWPLAANHSTVTINGFEYTRVADVYFGKVEVNEPCHVFIENSDIELINNTDELLHVMYKRSTISAKVTERSKHISNIYQKQNFESVEAENKRLAEIFILNQKRKENLDATGCVHIVVHPYKSDYITNIPEMPFVNIGGKKY